MAGKTKKHGKGLEPRRFKLSDELKIECPGCHEASEAGDWDAMTYGACIGRESRREFRSLTDSKSWEHGDRRYYMCPHCRNLFATMNLIPVTEDERVKKLGCRPMDSRVEVKDEEE